MTDKKNEGPVPKQDQTMLENFVRAYMDAYREYISKKDMDEIHTPQFFKGFPYSADIYTLSNGAVCAFFTKGSRSKYSVLDGDRDDVLNRLRNQELDFMAIFPPFTSFKEDEAKRLARSDADRDLVSSRRLEMLTAAKSHITDIHSDIQAVADLNPWLDKQAAEQREKLDKAKELILELYSEVETSREERFSDYMRQVTEVLAFEKGDMEEVASELSVRVETAIEEMEGRLAELEKAMESGAVGKIGTEMSGLSAQLKKLEERVDEIEETSTEELETDLEDLTSSFKDLREKFRDIEKQFKASNAESTEVKETVMRDSKRTFNLNERITDLERTIPTLKGDSGKETLASVKALEGRLNVMEKQLKDISKRQSILEKMSSEPVVIESAPVETVERTPDGKTVKRTVKKKTTKKTTRSK